MEPIETPVQTGAGKSLAASGWAPLYNQLKTIGAGRGPRKLCVQTFTQHAVQLSVPATSPSEGIVPSRCSFTFALSFPCRLATAQECCAASCAWTNLELFKRLWPFPIEPSAPGRSLCKRARLMRLWIGPKSRTRRDRESARKTAARKRSLTDHALHSGMPGRGAQRFLHPGRCEKDATCEAAKPALFLWRTWACRQRAQLRFCTEAGCWACWKCAASQPCSAHRHAVVRAKRIRSLLHLAKTEGRTLCTSSVI